MRILLTTLVLAFPAVVGAVEKSAPKAKKNSIPALDILPDGSELKGVIIPRYDVNHDLTSVLKSEKMTLVKAGQISGTVVSIEMFNPDHTSRARIDLAKAMYDQTKDVIESHEPVKIRNSRLIANGAGLVYYFPSQEIDASPVQGTGLLLGPATTTLLPAPILATSMNSPVTPLRATAMLGMALISVPLATAGPRPEITAAEKAGVEADARSRASVVREANAGTHTAVEKDLADAATASKAAANFLVQADLPPTEPDKLPDAKPLETKPQPGDTVINCDGGLYFDPEEGVLVYLKNVIVHDPRFDLSGTINELKVFFGKKPVAEETDANKEKAKDDKSKEDPGGFGANFGQIERIVATGAIVMERKPVKKGDELIKASGAIFSYNIKEDKIIISGGFPWVIKGNMQLSAKKANQWLRVSPKAGTMVTDLSEWSSSVHLEEKK